MDIFSSYACVFFPGHRSFKEELESLLLILEVYSCLFLEFSV